MARTSNLLSSGFVSLLCTLMWACGGGGTGPAGDELAEAPPPPPAAEQLGRLEIAPWTCSFDSVEQRDLAARQYPLDFSRCLTDLIGNTRAGQPEPARAWPSSPAVQ